MKFAALIAAMGFTFTAYAAAPVFTCTREDSGNFAYLPKAVKAEVFKREHDFDSRIRFYDATGTQVTTCSTVGTDSGNIYECYGRDGSQGQYDAIELILMLSSAEKDLELAARKQRFKLLVLKYSGGNTVAGRGPTFLCQPN
jgi:hypothetical protein